MKHILCKLILPLFCATLIACSSVVTAFALESGDGAVPDQPPAEPPALEQPDSEQPDSEQPDSEQPDAEQVPTPEASLPPEIQVESSTEPNYGVTLFWPWSGEGEAASSGISYERVWNPDTHSYKGLKSENNFITVTNDSASGAEIQITLRFTADINGVPMAFAPGEEDPFPEDFTVWDDGSIEFVLPRPSGESSVNIYLWPVGEWNGEVMADYQAVGVAQSTLVVVGGLVTPDTQPLPEPPEPDWTPPVPGDDVMQEPAEQPAEDIVQEPAVQPAPMPPEAVLPPQEEPDSQETGPEPERTDDPSQEEPE